MSIQIKQVIKIRVLEAESNTNAFFSAKTGRDNTKPLGSKQADKQYKHQIKNKALQGAFDDV